MNTKKELLLLSTTAVLLALFMTGVSLQGVALGQSNQSNQTVPGNVSIPIVQPGLNTVPPNQTNYDPPLADPPPDLNCNSEGVPEQY